MLKPGVVRYSQLVRPHSWFGAQRFPSLLLLGELADRGVRESTHYDDILRMLQMANGTWKDTAHGRLRVLDDAVVGLLAGRHRQGAGMRVLDLGVASGITSVEFYRALRARFTVDYLATDLWREAIAVRRLGHRWCVVFDHASAVLQHVIGPFVLPGQSGEPWLYPLNHLVKWWSERAFVPRARAVLQRYDPATHADFEAASIDGFEVVKLPLLSAECLALCATVDDIRFETLDVLQPFRHRADVIRAMNLITPGHLGEVELQRAVTNCLEALNPGGLLILGRSPTQEPADVDATIFALRDGVPEVLQRLNRGSQVEHLVLGGQPGARLAQRR